MVNTQLLHVQNVHTKYCKYFRGFFEFALAEFARNTRKLMYRKYSTFTVVRRLQTVSIVVVPPPLSPIIGSPLPPPLSPIIGSPPPPPLSPIIGSPLPINSVRETRSWGGTPPQEGSFHFLQNCKKRAQFTRACKRARLHARAHEIVLPRPPSLQKKNCPIASGGVVFYGNWTCFVHYNIGLNPYWAA